MLPGLTFERYQELGGKLGPDGFDASISAAMASVADIIGHNRPVDDEDITAYERAVCAAIAVDNAYGASGGIGEGIASVSLGRFSASMGQAGAGGQSAYRQDMEGAVRRELVGSSLLYQGLS